MTKRLLLTLIFCLSGFTTARADTVPTPTFTAGANIVAAGTTLLIAHITGKTTTLYNAGIEGSGTNSSSTYQLEYGTQTTNPCDTNTVLIFPAASQTGITTAGRWSTWTSPASNSSYQSDSPGPLSWPPLYLVPASQDVCVVAGGTTIAFNGVAWFTQP